MFYSLSFSLFISLTLAQITFPPLLGPHNVGTTTLYLPNSKTSPPRDIMISLFYPTLPKINSTIYPLATVYDPLYVSFLETEVGVPPGLASTVLSHAHTSSPLLISRQKPNRKKCDNPNIILFSPGYGNSRLDYTATLSNLASEGYIVIAVDHPNDTTFISYPDGRGVFHLPLELNDTTAAEVVELRVKDLRFVLDSLAQNVSIAKKVLPGLKLKLDISNTAIFGHSLGGAASASVILADKRLECGVSLDGRLVGPVVSKGLKNKPFLIMAAERHNSSNDESWKRFWDNSKGGFELEVAMKGSEHRSYSDQAFLYGELVRLGALPSVPVEQYGSIDGKRGLEVEGKLLTAFFDYCFTRKKGPLLKGPSKGFPELVYWPN